MSNVFKMKILDIQPSQLYISEMKLKKVSEWLNSANIDCYEPLPVRELNGKIIFTDGHTRAFALYEMGIKEIPCIWDTDVLDLALYQNCVDWCLKEGISSISHLSIISHDEYKELWYDRCEKLLNELSNKRKGN